MSLKVLELFSGIGAQHKALTNLGLDVECTQCEIDKYAIQAYNAIHGTTNNLGDISAIKEEDLKEDQWDLITYSFPCQSISIAGKQEGFIKGSGTTSSLLWEVEKFIKKVKPKYLLMENVKALVSKKFKPHFETWLNLLDSYGYKSYWEVLNAKDYGVPQNRERVFVVSIRKDIEQEYKFPEKIPLTIRLKDILEDAPNEKYYLSKTVQDRFIVKPIGENIIGTTKGEDNTRKGQRDLCYKEDGVMGALTSTDYKQPKQVAIEQIGTLDIKGNDCIKRVYNPNGISPSLTTMQGGNRQPKVIEEPKILEMNKEARHQQDLVQHEDGICRCIPAGTHGSTPHLLKTMVSIKSDKVIEPSKEPKFNNKRLNETIEKNKDQIKDGTFIDSYNKTINNDIAETITTRVSLSNCTHIAEEYQQDLVQHEITVDDSIRPSVASNFEREKEEIAKSNKDIYQAKCDSGFQDNKLGLKISPTLRAGNTFTATLDNHFRIRKLTPRECYRLMGFTDEDFDKVKQLGISDSQCYKQAGNSIVVNVLEAIFKNLFIKNS